MDTPPDDLAAAGQTPEESRFPLKPAFPLRKVPFTAASPVSSALRIFNTGTPGPGGAMPFYMVVLPEGGTVHQLRFQQGTIREAGINGVTVELLLAICIDQLEQFQAGPFPCPENSTAIVMMQEAKAALDRRTRERSARGVEGVHTR